MSCFSEKNEANRKEILDSHHHINLPISICEHVLCLLPITNHTLSPCSYISQAIHARRVNSIPSHLPKDVTLRNSPLSLPQHQFSPLYRTITISVQIPCCFIHLKTKIRNTASSFDTSTVSLLPSAAPCCLYLVLLISLRSETRFNQAITAPLLKTRSLMASLLLSSVVHSQASSSLYHQQY